ncbi:G patch domain-containing protein 4 [Engraulis encrasicolus]|uniref:G patch domain-containing protein 4 n=1 Tax=Engraulis encrasicolus TaxID=184585 RepID=UPI002FD1BF5E
MAEAISEKTSGLSFAEQQMLRHGWQPGKGLGRLEDGMSEPVKVKVKTDKGGVGHKLSDQFTFNWWDHVFNKASTNLSVESGQDGVTMKKVKDEEEEGMISNKRPLKAKLAKNMQYGCFVKSATLLSGEVQPEQRASGSDDSSDSDDDDRKLDLSSATNLSDAELLKICGGRTAHKGARHGLTMSAKLARLEQQEQEFLAKYGKKATPASSSAAPSPAPSPIPVSAPQSPSGADDDNNNGGNDDGDKDVPKKTKRKKEKKRRTEEAEAEMPDSTTNGDVKETPDIPDGGQKEKKKKKKKSSKEEVDADADNSPPVEAPLEYQEIDDAQPKKKKKKKKKSHQEVLENGCEEDTTTPSTEEPVAVDDHSSSMNGDCEKPSKKKRSKKGITNGVDSVVNGQNADVANKCERDSKVSGAGTEDCVLNQETSIDADSTKTKKKKKKKSKENIVTLCQEGERQSEDLQEVRSDVLMDGEEGSTDVKSKSKKRKAAGLNNTDCNEGGDMSVKIRKKAKRKE